ncbi:MAG: HAD family phosphatase [Kosmotogaceae bacterium]
MFLYMFDMGGVVVKNFDVAPLIGKEFNMTREELLKEVGEELLKALSSGQVSEKQFWDSFYKKTGIKSNRYDWWIRYFKPEKYSEVEKLINKLRKNYRVICATNTFDSHYRYFLERGDYELFDRVYASNIIGYAKPDPQFYLYILNQEKIEPRRAIFMDDKADNVKSAREIGINAFQVTDPSILPERLKSFENSLKLARSNLNDNH